MRFYSAFIKPIRARGSVIPSSSRNGLTIWAFFLFIACLVTSYPTSALAVSDQHDLLDYSAMPPEYGEVVFRTNEASPKQLYIIGISHRDPQTGLNAGDTVQAQTEIFRIGEWLNKSKDLKLLLPEGYFKKKKPLLPAVARVERQDVQRSVAWSVDNALLQKRLADETSFANAEMLLMENYDMFASQVEDRNHYNAVLGSLGKLSEDSAPANSRKETMAELQYLQELRVAMLLQKIPTVVDTELLNGTIRNPFALFTIGLYHLQDIIRYFEDQEIQVDTPLHAPELLPDYHADLNLLTKGYGITIIIPRTLVADRRLLQLANLERVVPRPVVVSVFEQ